MLVEGDEWAHVEVLDPDAGCWARRFAQLVNWRARGEKAVIEPSSLRRRNSSSSSRKSRLRGGSALTESEFEAVKASLLSDEASGLRSWSDARNGRVASAAPVQRLTVPSSGEDGSVGVSSIRASAMACPPEGFTSSCATTSIAVLDARPAPRGYEGRGRALSGKLGAVGPWLL